MLLMGRTIGYTDLDLPNIYISIASIEVESTKCSSPFAPTNPASVSYQLLRYGKSSSTNRYDRPVVAVVALTVLLSTSVAPISVATSARLMRYAFVSVAFVAN